MTFGGRRRGPATSLASGQDRSGSVRGYWKTGHYLVLEQMIKL